MPTGNNMDVTICLTDGTPLRGPVDFCELMTFLEEHKETYVKVVRCTDCRYAFDPFVEDILCMYWESDGLSAADYCSQGKRMTAEERIRKEAEHGIL